MRIRHRGEGLMSAHRAGEKTTRGGLLFSVSNHHTASSGESRWRSSRSTCRARRRRRPESTASRPSTRTTSQPARRR
jgi:hypothetical protein